MLKIDKIYFLLLLVGLFTFLTACGVKTEKNATADTFSEPVAIEVPDTGTSKDEHIITARPSDEVVSEQTSVTPTTLPEITKYVSRRVVAPRYTDIWSESDLVPTVLPHWNDRSSDQWFQVDLRGKDLRGLDLANDNVLNDLLHSIFDTNTLWPDGLPDGFIPNSILEIGKNPGLGVRQLHDKEITGAGISIGIIDQPLLTSHVEYKDNLVLYEEIPALDDYDAAMHGSAVASLAVGKNVGVAPGAWLYYIAGKNINDDNKTTYEYTAQAINRLLDINETLPKGQKIRAISISIAFISSNTGYPEIEEALARAKDNGVFVIGVPPTF